MTGSNADGIFSLSSDEHDENGSLGHMGGEEGVVGVMGMSSDISEIDVVVLIGVLNADVELRVGVTGNGRCESLLNRPPSR